MANAVRDQYAAENVLTTPPAILDFSNASYLKRAVTTWKTCIAPNDSTASATASTSIDLEALAASRNPDIGSTLTPLVDITQGSSNMCSAFAFAQAYTIKFALLHPGGIVPQLSPVYAYYLQRVEECTTTGVCPCPKCPSGVTCVSTCDPPCVDCGSYILSATSIYGTGVCTSLDWPLNTPIDTTPSATARKKAAGQRISSVNCIPVDDSFADSVLTHLLAEHPVIVFLHVTDSIEKWLQSMVNRAAPASATATILLPNVGTNAVTAGHVVCIVGYNATADVFIVRNSYGFKWGANGRFAIARAAMTADQIEEAAAVVAVD
jgi:hypothetical protein